MSTPDTIPKRYYGWKPDTSPHLKNKQLSELGFKSDKPLPPKHVIENLPEVYDQGHIGSCTANAIANLLRHEKKTL